jgi:hypothetical protein
VPNGSRCEGLVHMSKYHLISSNSTEIKTVDKIHHARSTVLPILETPTYITYPPLLHTHRWHTAHSSMHSALSIQHSSQILADSTSECANFNLKRTEARLISYPTIVQWLTVRKKHSAECYFGSFSGGSWHQLLLY